MLISRDDRGSAKNYSSQLIHTPEDTRLYSGMSGPAVLFSQGPSILVELETRLADSRVKTRNTLVL